MTKKGQSSRRRDRRGRPRPLRRRARRQSRRGDDERADLRVTAALQAEPHGHGEEAEEEAGERCEEDGAQVLRSARGFGSYAHPEDHRRTPRRQHGGGDRAAHRSDPPRRRDRHHGLPAVRAARRRPCGRPDRLVRRPQHAAVRQQEPRGPRLPPQLGSALRGALLAAGERHLALPPPRALRPAGPGAARRGQPHDDGRRARDARDRGRARRRWRSRWPAGRTCSSGRGSPESSCAAGCGHGCSRRTSCSSCSGGETFAAAEA